jgi:hypothetical protein
VQLTDVHETIRDQASRSVRFEHSPGLEQDDAGVWSAPSGARVAWFEDPDGNILSIAQHTR